MVLQRCPGLKFLSVKWENYHFQLSGVILQYQSKWSPCKNFFAIPCSLTFVISYTYRTAQLPLRYHQQWPSASPPSDMISQRRRFSSDQNRIQQKTLKLSPNNHVNKSFELVLNQWWALTLYWLCIHLIIGSVTQPVQSIRTKLSPWQRLNVLISDMNDPVCGNQGQQWYITFIVFISVKSPETKNCVLVPQNESGITTEGAGPLPQRPPCCTPMLLQ